MAVNFRPGLRGQLLCVLAALLLLLLAATGVLWREEQAMHAEVRTLTGSAMSALSRETLQRRGQQLATNFAASTTAAIASGDRTTIANLARGVRHQPEVVYVIVYDAGGRIVDDGTAAGHTGQAMVDPLASAALAATTTTSQWADNLLDVSVPILQGEERIGGVRVGLVGNRPSPEESRILGPLNEHLEQA